MYLVVIVYVVYDDLFEFYCVNVFGIELLFKVIVVVGVSLVKVLLVSSVNVYGNVE